MHEMENHSLCPRKLETKKTVCKKTQSEGGAGVDLLMEPMIIMRERVILNKAGGGLPETE